MKYLALVLSLLIVGCGEANVPVGTFAKKLPSTLENQGYATEDHEIDGMKYRVFFKEYVSSQTGYTVFVVNLTKDKLEVQLLEQKLKENKSP